jgi:hypothetical protein
MRILALMPIAGLAACLGPAPPPPDAPYELATSGGCATTRFEDGAAGDPATLDRLTGVYAAGRESITVSRQGSRFLLHRVRYGVRDLIASAPGGMEFRDGCNQHYRFDAQWLTVTATNGVASRWQRRAY